MKKVISRGDPEKTLRESEDRFRELVEGSIEGILIHCDFKPMFVNSAYANILGFDSPEQVMALDSVPELAAPHMRAQTEGNATARLRGDGAPTDYEYEGLKKDGSTIWLNIRVRVITWRSEPAILSTVVDISERKRAEKALRDAHDKLEQRVKERTVELENKISERDRVEKTLRASEDRFKDFAESVSDWFWEMDENLRFSYLSPTVEKIVGVAPEWHYGKTREDLLGGDYDRDVWDLHLQTLKARQPFRDFAYFRVGEGIESKWLSTSGKPIFDAGGKFLGYRGSGRDITEWKQREIAQRSSDERFRAITEASPVPLIITRRSDGTILYANPKVGPAFGLEGDEVVGRSIREFYWDFSGREERLAALEKDGYVRDDEVDMRKADGSRISTVHSLQVIEYQGEAAVLGGFYDITERKRTERELRQSEERIRDMTASLPGIVYQFKIDAAGESSFPYVSPAIKEILGIEAADVVADPNTWIEAVHPDDRASVFSSTADSRRSLDPWLWEGRMIRTSGEVGWFRRSSIPRLQDDGSVLWTGLELDITEQKRAEEALKESEERFRSIIDNTPAAVYLKDTEGRYLLVNKRFEEWYGYSASDSIGKTTYDLFPRHLADGYMASDREVILSGQAQEYEFEAPFADGTTRLVATTKFPVRDSHGQIIGVGTINTDITDRKQTEAQLRQAQKMEAVGQLTGGVAHDFNNLLASILGHAEIIEDKLGRDDKSVKTIIRAAERGAQLTQRLLSFSRRQALFSRPVDLRDLVGDVHQLLHRTLGETIEIDIVMAPALWNAVADPGQLENALLNLAINARDAMPDGGKLIIEAANVSLNIGDATSHMEVTPGDYVSLSVRDSGVGMQPDVLEHAFEPFFTTKGVGEGSGLGLSMVYGFAKQSGGDVTIVSEPGHGTTVRIYLPRAKDSGERPSTDDTPSSPRGDGETVLVIEDDADVRTMTEAMLKNLGYRVLSVGHARAGLDILQVEPKIDLILSDVVLPGGMSGPDMAEQAKGLSPEIRTLFMSGYAQQSSHLLTALPEGCDLLDKPFRKFELARRVRAALDR